MRFGWRNLQEQFPFEPRGYRSHYPVGGHLTSAVDRDIVSVSDKSQSSVFKFLVKYIQIDVGKERRNITTLGRP